MSKLIYDKNEGKFVRKPKHTSRLIELILANRIKLIVNKLKPN